MADRPGPVITWPDGPEELSSLPDVGLPGGPLVLRELRDLELAVKLDVEALGPLLHQLPVSQALDPGVERAFLGFLGVAG